MSDAVKMKHAEGPSLAIRLGYGEFSIALIVADVPVHSHGIGFWQTKAEEFVITDPMPPGVLILFRDVTDVDFLVGVLGNLRRNMMANPSPDKRN